MIATSPDGQWAAVRRGREVVLLASGAGPATARIELPTDDADLVLLGPPSVLAVVTRGATGGGEPCNRMVLYQPPNLDPVARLDLDTAMRIAAITGPRLVLLSADGKTVVIVRVAGRALASQVLDPGSPVEFAVGLERNQVLFALLRKLEAWDAVSGRPLLRMQLPLPPPPRTVGPAHGHLWAARPGSDDIVVCRLSDGRPFRHQLGVPIDQVIYHPASPLLILATEHGLVRLHCFAHALTVIEAPWRRGMALAQLVVGDDISLLGMADTDAEPWRVPIGGAGAPAITLEAPDAPSEPVVTAAHKLRAMRERMAQDPREAGDAATAQPPPLAAHGAPGGPGGPPGPGGLSGPVPAGPGGLGRPGGFSGHAGPGGPAGFGGHGGHAGPGDPGGPGGHAGPGGPAGFGGHAGPGGPAGFGGHGGHAGPGGPGGPGGHAGPGGPAGFGGHAGPDGPAGFGAHAGPGGPGAPAGLGGPGAPAGPGGHGGLVGHGGPGGPAGHGLPGLPGAPPGLAFSGAPRPGEPRTRTWRDPLALFAIELARGAEAEVPVVTADTELGQLAHRLALPVAARRALIALYSLYLIGEAGVPIARLAHALGDWAEALGQGELGALAMLRRRGGRIGLRGSVTDLLDGAGPRAIRVVGTAAAAPRSGAARLARDGRSDAAIETELAAQLGRIAVIEGGAALALLEARLHGTTAVALAPPPSRPLPWPRDAALIVVAEPAAPAWVAALPVVTAA